MSKPKVCLAPLQCVGENGPELSDHHMLVRLVFPKPVNKVESMEVRLCGPKHDYCGWGTVGYDAPTKVVDASFHVCTDKACGDAPYYIYVYVNKAPYWVGKVVLCRQDNLESTGYLKKLEYDSPESRFADSLTWNPYADLDYFLKQERKYELDPEIYEDDEDEEPDEEDLEFGDEDDDEELELDDVVNGFEDDDEFEKALSGFLLEDRDFSPDRFNSTPEQNAMEQLQELVGLTRVKEEIESVRTMAMFVKRRRELGMDSKADNRYHMLFMGNPGTGKTTVAKLVGRMFHEMGLLSSGHTVEVNRAKLVGEYIGQTEQNTEKVIEEARGGVLFIDEAYALAAGQPKTNDYGKEVVNALLPVLSAPNPDMIVILAGYDDKMKWLLESNQGLKDRFPLSFHFDDYSAEELLEMAHRIARKQDFTFTVEAEACLRKMIEEAVARRNEHFGNGRWIQNLMEQGVIKALAVRAMKMDQRRQELGLSEDDLKRLFSLIEESDVREADRMWVHQTGDKMMETRRIGFARG